MDLLAQLFLGVVLSVPIWGVAALILFPLSEGTPCGTWRGPLGVIHTRTCGGWEGTAFILSGLIATIGGQWIAHAWMARRERRQAELYRR